MSDRKCPVCIDPTLETSRRQDIEIDTCPRCRGVWLDRGELDKIVRRAQEEMSAHDRMPRHGDPVTHNQPGSRHGPAPERSSDPAERAIDDVAAIPSWIRIFD